MKRNIGILTVAAVMLFAQTATYAAEQTTKEREGGKISGQETQKQSGQEMQKKSGPEMQKQSGQETQRQSGQEMQQQSGQPGQAASGNFSEEMQRQTKQFWQAGQQSQAQCQRPVKSQPAASQQPATQPSQPGQQSASQQQPATQPSQPGQQSASQQQTGQQPGQAGREQSQQATQDQGKQAQGQSAAGLGSAQTLKGQFVRMENDFYIIKDQNGKEVCIPTSYGTFIDQTFVPGDNIVARLGSDGSATVLGRADTQTASAGTQGQGMTGSSSREQEFAGSQQGSQGQGMTPGPTEQTPKGREKDLTASQQTPAIVKGELLKIQGEFYTVKEQSGNEIRLHVNKETKLEGVFNVGDRIEAERTPSDHAVSIKKTQDSGGSTRPR